MRYISLKGKYMSKSIYFVRHGESEWNVADRICGATDIPLTERGHQQAIDTGREILNLGIKADKILYSPLARAAETARHISEMTGIPMQAEPRLTEQNFGIWEGTSPRNAAEFRAAKRQFINHYGSGESMFRMAQRIYNLLDDLAEDDKTYILVAHNGIARVVKSYFEDMTNEEYADFGVANCSVNEWKYPAAGLACFDLDMTLLDHSVMEIPASSKKALEILRKKGYLIALCTGRNMDNPANHKYLDEIMPEAVVQNNGQKVTYKGRTIYEVRIDRETIARALELGKEHGFAIGVTLDDRGYFVHPEINREIEERTIGKTTREYCPAEWLLDEEKNLIVHSLVIHGRSAEETEAAAKLVEENMPDLKCMLFSSNTGADVTVAGNSKAHAVEQLIKEVGGVRKVVAFGDSDNDVELLEMADLGIAMGNASDTAKDAADMVTEHISDHGILKAVQSWL